MVNYKSIHTFATELQRVVHQIKNLYKMSKQLERKNWTSADLIKAIANGNLKAVKKTNYIEIEGGIQLPDGTQILDGAQRRLANELKTQQQKN